MIMMVLALLVVRQAGAQSSATGLINAQVLLPVSLSEKEVLDFGTVVNDQGGGTVLVLPDNTLVTTGELLQSGSLFSPGKFIVSGFRQNAISVIFPQSSQKLKRARGGEVMVVDNFTSEVIPSAGSDEGKAEISVGGTLHVGNWVETPPGTYTGQYEVIVTCN